jgi:RND family efflux transporter MFP subunit
MTRETVTAALAGGVVLPALLLTAACAKPGAVATYEPPDVSVTRIVRGDLAQTLRLPAEFRPYQEVEVHAKVAGYVKAINVDVGDRVTAGQLLAVLEIPELQDEMAQDAASVNRSREEINRAQADLDRAESVHDVAHLGSSRLASVMKQRPNLIAQQDIDEAMGRDKVAEAQVATAKASLASAREQLAVATATQNKTKTLFAYARITAPFAGVITHRYADSGVMIQAGTSSQSQAMPVVRLSQNSVLRLTIQVPESAVSRVHVGAPVDVVVQSLDRTFTGKVARLSERLSADTRTMETEVDVPNGNFELVPGMYAYASIALERAERVLLAPVQAVDRKDDKNFVLVVGAGRRLESHEIKIGLEAPDRVEVRDGVREGDLLVVGNRSQLKPGMVVSAKIVDAAPSPSPEGGR